MGKRSFLITKIKFPKDYKGAGILRVLFDQILWENLIQVVKRETFMKNIQSKFILSSYYKKLFTFETAFLLMRSEFLQSNCYMGSIF